MTLGGAPRRSISIANSPPSRTMRLVSTLPSSARTRPVTSSTSPTRSAPVRVKTISLRMVRTFLGGCRGSVSGVFWRSVRRARRSARASSNHPIRRVDAGRCSRRSGVGVLLERLRIIAWRRRRFRNVEFFSPPVRILRCFELPAKRRRPRSRRPRHSDGRDPGMCSAAPREREALSLRAAARGALSARPRRLLARVEVVTNRKS